MKRLLFDVNVVLDVLLDRKPHADASTRALAAVEAGGAAGFLAGRAVTTIYYLVRKDAGAAQARRTVSALLKVLRVAAVDGATILEALQLPCSDFEDAVTAAAARVAECDSIVTRDPQGFRGSPVAPLKPEMVLSLIATR